MWQRGRGTQSKGKQLRLSLKASTLFIMKLESEACVFSLISSVFPATHSALVAYFLIFSGLAKRRPDGASSDRP